MKILINAVGRDYNPDSTELFYNIAENISGLYPENEVVILLPENDRSVTKNNYSGLKPVFVKHSSSPVLGGFITEKKIISEIHNHQPDIVVTIDGLKDKKLPPVVWMAGKAVESLLLKPGTVLKRQKKEREESLKNSDRIVVYSKAEKTFLAEQFPEYSAKIKIIYRTVSPISTTIISFEQKQLIKEKISGGSEYFLCHPATDQQILTTVLKGFTGFKKWQKSGMKMILSAAGENSHTQLTELISAYRFKNDVSIVTVNTPGYTDIIAGAYAFLLPEKYNPDFNFPLSAIKSGTALIIPENSICAEIMQDKAFHFKYRDKDDITRVLLESFRDERRRSEIILSSKEVLEQAEKNNFYRLLMQHLTNLQVNRV